MPAYWNLNEAKVMIGQPLLERLPSLAARGFEDIMHKVIASGERFIAGELSLNISRSGKTETLYLNLTLELVENGIMALAADVTEQVTACASPIKRTLLEQ